MLQKESHIFQLAHLLFIKSLPLAELIWGVALCFPFSCLLFFPPKRIYIFDSAARGCQSFYQCKACLFNNVNSKPWTLTWSSSSTQPQINHFLLQTFSYIKHFDRYPHQLFPLKLFPNRSDLTDRGMRYLFVGIFQWSCWKMHIKTVCKLWQSMQLWQALTKACTQLKVKSLQWNFSFMPYSIPDTLTKPYLSREIVVWSWIWK